MSHVTTRPLDDSPLLSWGGNLQRERSGSEPPPISSLMVKTAPALSFGSDSTASRSSRECSDPDEEERLTSRYVALPMPTSPVTRERAESLDKSEELELKDGALKASKWQYVVPTVLAVSSLSWIVLAPAVALFTRDENVLMAHDVAMYTTLGAGFSSLVITADRVRRSTHYSGKVAFWTGINSIWKVGRPEGTLINAALSTAPLWLDNLWKSLH